MKRVLVILADGCEDIELLTPVDVLRRAGCEVILASLEGTAATTSRNVKIGSDCNISSVSDEEFDAVVIPGGMPGAANIARSVSAEGLVRKAYNEKKIIASICAAPSVVLAKWGLLDGRRAVCYPGMENREKTAVIWENTRVYRDSNILTSRGPGCALEFSLELVKMLFSEEKAKEISEAMLF